LSISGSVTDATTGLPIPTFRIITGCPTTDTTTGATGAEWSTIDRFWLKFQGGTFHYTYTEPVVGGAPNPGYIFKFEADGYAPFVTRPVASDEGSVEFNVTLRPSASASITVLLPDGQPAVAADVGLVSTGSRLDFQPGGFSHENIQSAESLLATDKAGRFSLSADPTVTEIVIAHPEGFAQTTPADLAAATTIQLQPWSRVEGTLLFDGQPASGRDVALRLENDDFQTIYADYDKFKSTTDSAGHFVFPQAPPGARQLALMVTVEVHPNGRSWSNVALTNLDLPPGETVTVTTSTTIPAERP
jgi:hypothetical protein